MKKVQFQPKYNFDFSKGGYLYKPKDAWEALTLAEKSEMMKVAVRNGITDLKTIREKYNEFAEGGYLDWKEKASKYKHLDIDNDRTYDYEGWYNENPQRAWDFLNDSPDAHFDDKYKTVYHPTFSTQSKYSGVVDPVFNPNGFVGGTWNKQGTVFTMSPDGYRGPVSMDERAWYLMNAEDNGVQLREADGSLPVFDGIPWGGVLPTVAITGNRFAGGGIFIRPENRGKFTRLKERIGHSATWFKEHGTPAQKKMATFDLNSRHWKQGLGGNLYLFGGEDDNNPRPVTTGGAGYIPPINVPTKQEVRKRLYENLNPYDYGNAAIRVAKAVIGNTKEKTLNSGVYMPEVDDLWATYLQIPKSERRKGNRLVNEGHHLKVLPGTYKPTKGSNGKYYKLNLNEDSKKAIVDEAMGNTYEEGLDISPNPYDNHLGIKRIKKDPIDVGENRVTTSYDRTLNWALRDFTVGRGRDNRGEYVSYYDLWDLSPYRLSSKDQSFGIGKPFEIYDRIYLDDYYGLPKEGAHYLPEVTIYGNKKSHGGSIHIDPSKKGTFTAAASKHGKSVQEFASQVLAHPENYSPAMRKKANFARNARRWKHGLGGNLFSGEEEGSQQMITTGGAGYIPNNYGQGAIDYIRKKLYDNILPWGYNDIPQRIYNAVVKNKKEEDETRDRAIRDDLFATYLQIPNSERHSIDGGKVTLSNSKYKPKGAVKGKPTYRFTELTPAAEYGILAYAGQVPGGINIEGEDYLPIGQNRVVYPNDINAYSELEGLGQFTVGRSYDNKGEYISYYDSWDLGDTNKPYKDKSLGIGRPFNVYDRIYLDDYYGVKEPTHATYLPEVVVYGKKKKAFGGNLFEGGGGIFGDIGLGQVGTTLDTVTSYLPITSSIQDTYSFIKEPSWENLGWAAASIGADLIGAGLLKGVKAATKTYKAAKKAEETAKKALETHRKTNRNIIARSVRERDRTLLNAYNNARVETALSNPFWEKAVAYPISGGWTADDALLNYIQKSNNKK